MRGNNRTGRWAARWGVAGGGLAALVAGILVSGAPLWGAGTRAAVSTRGGTTGRATTAGAAGAAAPTAASSSAPGTTATAASRPAIQADVILSKFPGNANVITARSDARNFTIEGRVRDVQTVTLDHNGIPVAPPAGGALASPNSGKTELRVVLVGRGQADDAPAHFTCRFDKATEEAAGKLKVDQVVRLTGTISAAAAAGDRIDMANCHDLSEAGVLNVGDQLVGMWRCSSVMVDGSALRKANQARGIKTEDVPDMNYSAPWHVDLLVKSDNSIAAELVDGSGVSLKKISGRFQVVEDTPTEARLRVTFQGIATAQEITASLDAGRLVLPLTAFADKFVLPELSFSEVEGVARPVDYKFYREETNKWFNANFNRSNTSLPQFINTAIDQAAANQQGFSFTVGGALLRGGSTTLVIGNYGKFMKFEYSDHESQVNANLRNATIHSPFPSWGVPCAAEVKVENLVIDSRNAFDPAKPLTGKIILRNLRRPATGTYLLGMSAPQGNRTIKIDPPGPDARAYEFRFDPQTSVSPNPRPVLVFVGRQVKGDIGAGGPDRVISDLIPVLLDMALGR